MSTLIDNAEIKTEVGGICRLKREYRAQLEAAFAKIKSEVIRMQTVCLHPKTVSKFSKTLGAEKVYKNFCATCWKVTSIGHPTGETEFHHKPTISGHTGGIISGEGAYELILGEVEWAMWEELTITLDRAFAFALRRLESVNNLERYRQKIMSDDNIG